VIGTTTGRMAYKENAALWLGRKAFVPSEDAVYVLDRHLSILMLDYDPGEGFEVHLPAYQPEENK
jgi:hypothetical protein